MKKTYANKIAIIFALITILSFAISSAQRNDNGHITVRVCLESSGGYTDPRNGDGAECDKYGTKIVSETKLRSALRGVGDAIVPALIAGFLGLYVGFKVDEHVVKSRTNKKHFN